MPDSDHGTPYDADSSAPVDDWSRSVFEACADWPLAASGRWYRSSEGWLLLRITRADGEPLEPLFAIELDTSEERILIDFGSWATPLTRSAGPVWEAAARDVAKARATIEQWLSGELKLASYSDESGWRGSKLIENGAWPEAIEPVPVTLGEGARATVKTWRRSDWRSWRRLGDGGWIECGNEQG